ncbi:hypothetical protein P5673_022047 [Acropora cervicornis]|uniref:TIR domain-containing protein n=1 Tax=Acropora cervicornis TaxID=6130 RepID=A0AAD9Q7K8_ACRCE|nr:hypothetical protein P5673_022047 [Acropora cervicornis]
MGCGSGKHVISEPHRPTIQLTGHRQLVGHIVPVSDGDLDTESLLDSEMDISCSGTVQKYIQEHPEFTREFKAVFHNVEKLQRLSREEHAFSDKLELTKINKEVLKLRKKSMKAAFSPGTPDEKKYNLIADFMIDIDAALLLFCLAENLFSSYLNCGMEQRSQGVEPGKRLITETDSLDHLASECLILILLVIQNFAEFHEPFCEVCTSKTGVVSLCLLKSKQVEDVFKSVNSDGSNRPVRAIRILGCCFNILYNLARKTELVKTKVDYEGKETLVYFAKSDIAIVSPLALLSLAYVVNEESNHLVLAAEEILGALTSILQKACESERRKFDGFSAKELAEGLGRLAVNDFNKKVLGEKGAISVLVALIKTSKDDREKATAARALWMLAFDESNKKLIEQENGALAILNELQRSKDPNVQKAAAGALWEIGDKTTRANENEASGNHVMISYQWENQKVLIEVKNKLQALGYRVWMDLEQMGGSTLEAMAKAVENASVVLICVSQKYKQSPNCRSEAEYAYQLRKDIIPLMMQRDYTPDGWLGIILGTRLWIDFRNDYKLSTSAEKLLKELGGRGLENQAKGGRVNEHEENCGRLVQEDTSEVVRIVDWTASEVANWMKDIGLNEICKAVLPKMDGQTLINLHALRSECPDYFYKCLETNLNLRDMFDLFKFREELSKLMLR